MWDDAVAARVLDEVIEQWTEAGLLGKLCDRAQQVYVKNLERHDEDGGDDALVLGVRSSRNLAHQTVAALAGVPGVHAELAGGRSLRVHHGGRTLGVSKAPSASTSWSPHAVDWSTSEVRQAAAEANSGVYRSAQGALFPLAAGEDPQMLSELHLVWQGLPEGGTRTWVGFPCAGQVPWFAVADLGSRGHAAASAPSTPSSAGPAAPARFDELAEAETPMELRRKSVTGDHDEDSTS